MSENYTGYYSKIKLFPEGIVNAKKEIGDNGYTLEFQIGEIVYLKTDEEQLARILTGINIRPKGSVTYALASGESETWHYAIEISREKMF